MRIDRVIYMTTIICVTINRALIVYDNYQRMKERREMGDKRASKRHKSYEQEEHYDELVE